MQRINAALNRYNMYILMRVYLGVLILAAAGLSVLDALPYDPSLLIGGSLYLAAMCLTSNWIFASLFRADTSVDSPLITALILTLIVGPHTLLAHWVVSGSIAIIAMASKYLLAWHAKHIFNPAALAVVISAILFSQGASWWIGTPLLLPLVLLGGLLIAHKIQRKRLVTVFVGAFLLFTVVDAIIQGTTAILPAVLENVLVSSPLFFFAFVILVEPATSPKAVRLQTYYGIGVAVLVVILQNVGIGYAFLLSLLAGNLLTRIFEPSQRYKLALTNTREEAEDTRSFIFRKPQGFDFQPGQFMVWALPHKHTDDRGNRRWLTLSSSPTEEEIMITTRFAQSSSSFKQALQTLKSGDTMTATGPDGEFTLPEDSGQPLVWVAGGIGITPFRSMAKYLYDIGEKRNITLFYGNRVADDIAFKEELDEWAPTIGLQPVYTLTDSAPQDWQYEQGFIDADMIKRHAPEYQEAMFYLSGPQAMVEAFEKMLRKAGVARDQIQTDYFPGYDD